MSLKLGPLAALGVAAIALSSSAGAAAHASGSTGATRAVAHMARACSVGSGEGYGYTYLTSLTVRRTTCATGKNLVRHKGRVRGWSCTRQVLARSPVQYDARETCKSGTRRVLYSYTQNT